MDLPCVSFHVPGLPLGIGLWPKTLTLSHGCRWAIRTSPITVIGNLFALMILDRKTSAGWVEHGYSRIPFWRLKYSWVKQGHVWDIVLFGERSKLP